VKPATVIQRVDHNMIALPATEPENCSESTRLRAREERVSSLRKANHDAGSRSTTAKQDCLKAIHDRLEQAAAIARAASACVNNGDPDKAVTIVLDVEQLICEVNTYLNAASLMNRCS
jgi:hypothetical protein